MTDWTWVDEAILRALHAEQLEIYGGAPGMRDPSLLQSALGRPQNRAGYGEADASTLAASYAFGIARNHPFVDGNKRAALIAAELFLIANGYAFTASDEAIIATFLSLAAGELSEEALAAWFKTHIASA